MMQTEIASNVQQSVSDVGQWFATNQSRLITAAVLLGLGVVLAFLLRLIASRIVTAIERAVPGRAFRTSFAGVARDRPVSEIVGGVVFWAVLLFFVATAADALGLALLSSVVASLSLFVPRVFAAVLILVAGLVMGNLARGAVTATASGAGTALGPGLGNVVRVAIVTAAVLIAVAELGVDIALLTAIFSVALAALLGGFALAFGLGARGAISNIIGSHYLRQTFEVGQTVRIGGIDGTIAELTATSVILDVPEGRTIVPARQFSDMASTLLVKRDTP
ncbi:MAG: mechanosensitive ion channel domain-containing protein [Gemmatimonadaceae bacterium]